MRHDLNTHSFLKRRFCILTWGNYVTLRLYVKISRQSFCIQFAYAKKNRGECLFNVMVALIKVQLTGLAWFVVGQEEEEKENKKKKKKKSPRDDR